MPVGCGPVTELHWEKCGSIFLVPLLRYLYTLTGPTPHTKPFDFGAKQSQFSQHPFIWQVLQSPHHLALPSTKSSIFMSFCTGESRARPRTPVRSNQCQVEQYKHLPWPAAMLFLLQPRILLAFLPGRLIAVSQSAWCLPGPPSHCLQSCFSAAQPQPVLVLSYSLWCSWLGFSPVELHENPAGPPLQALKTHLNGNTTFSCSVPSASPSFASSAEGVPSSGSWAETWARSQHWPRADPCRAALVSSWTFCPWAQPSEPGSLFGHFSIHIIDNLPSPYFITLSLLM